MEFMSALGSQEDTYRPSIFELVAQEKLRELLQPAVQYILAIYAQRYPRLLIPVVNNHEEFYAALMFFVERHYLKEWGASFAENFYGLKRVSSAYVDGAAQKFSLNASTPALSRKEIHKSLLVLVGLPYVKCRLDLLYQRISGGSSSILGENEQEQTELDELYDSQTPPRRKLVIRLIRLLRKIYPFLNALYHGSNLAYNIAYLFGATRYHTPWLHLIGVEIKRMTMADYRAYYDKMAAAEQQAAKASIFTNPLSAISNVFGKLFAFLKVLLPMSIFFFKFLEWWYSSEFARGGGNSLTGDSSPNAIPPPEKAKPDPRGISLPSTSNTCPLCLSSPINNPTALPTGYVFCYPCAYRYVEEHGKCPVTWIKVQRGTEDLVKVYADGNL
ncbi:ubiquitin-protein ligase peroxin 12 [Apophysomyces ossiformis]|uniref:Peroxisome assembly protein 12 n=1 Tax=Apophysomyces ossiformis TaxID=679940 RepID=A0A8H7EP13_9FUNG|nr:ubiquitin-protein ligase peroxin 12 [Apophysomyces ossiformis]